MKLRDNQTFLSLYHEPNVVEVANGRGGFACFGRIVAAHLTPAPLPIRCGEGGKRRQLGQVSTPESIAALMAKWVMSAKPRTVLDPAAGLGGLLIACRQLNGRGQLVGVERDTGTLQRAKTTAPRGTKLILTDYLKSEAGLFDGIIANPPYGHCPRKDVDEQPPTTGRVGCVRHRHLMKCFARVGLE
jgi:adenine-specific DNA-methyltransferase